MLYLDIAIIVGEIAGMVFSTQKHGWWGQFIYYTQLSNLILLLATAVHLACLLRKKMPDAVEKCRYYAACLTTVTFLVTVCILIPWYGHPEFFLLESNGLFQHLLCPLLAVAGLPLLKPVRKKDALIAVIPTAVYGVAWYALGLIGGAVSPYPFLQVNNQPWYMSVMWFAVIAAAAYGIAAVMGKLCGKKSFSTGSGTNGS